MSVAPSSDAGDADDAREVGVVGDEAALEAEFAVFQREFLGGVAVEEAPLPQEVASLIAKLQAADFSVPSNEAEAFALLDRPPEDGRPGALGAFEIDRLLACGGMGVVFVGRDPALGREVAIKVLSPRLKTDETARRRFRGETRTLAALDHPHILPIHSVHEKEGQMFFVMPLVRGRSLAARVEQEGVLSGKEVAEIGGQAARALAAAHTQGLVHRDLKPENLLLDEDGRRVRIADFGLATLEGEARSTAGTPRFMAPEQRRGDVVTARADLYSLGATLHFALTGQAPEDARADSPAVARTRGDARPPGGKPGALPPGCPRWLGRLIHSLLAEDPAQRPLSAEAVARTFDHFRQRKKRWSLAAAVLLGIALAAALPAVLSPLGFYGWWNRALASFSDNKFHVEGRPGVYPTLKSAAQAANGRTIYVDFDGERAQPPTDFGTFPVVVRAAPGRHPVLWHERPASPLFSARAPLRLEGLGFLRRAPAGQVTAPFVRGIDTSLALTRCRMVIEKTSGPPQKVYSPPVLLIGAASAVLEDCEIDAGPEPWAVVRRYSPRVLEIPSRLRVVRSRVRGVGLFVLRSPGLRMEVEMSESAITSDLAFAHWTQRGSQLRVTATECEFITRRALMWLEPSAQDTVRQAFVWKGWRNEFSFPAKERPPFLRVAGGPVELEIFTFEDWQAHPAVKEEGPVIPTLDAEH